MERIFRTSLVRLGQRHADSELDELLRFVVNCEELGRGTLVSVQLLAYPCSEGPRNVEIMATGEPITESMVTDACAWNHAG